MTIIISRKLMQKIRNKEIRFHLGGLGHKIYLIRGYKYGFKYCAKCKWMYYLPEGDRCPEGHRIRSSPRLNDSRREWLKSKKRIKVSAILK
jgi:hypothetical protein